MGVPDMLEPVFLQDFRPRNQGSMMFDELGFLTALANVSVTPDPAQSWDSDSRLIRRQTDLPTHDSCLDPDHFRLSAHPPTGRSIQICVQAAGHRIFGPVCPDAERHGNGTPNRDRSLLWVIFKSRSETASRHL